MAAFSASVEGSLSGKVVDACDCSCFDVVKKLRVSGA